MIRAREIAIAAFVLTLLVGVSDGAPGTITPRIVNGETTQERPTTGALLKKVGGFRGQTCSGTLIGCQTFITAAHCVCVNNSAATCGTPDPAGYAVYLQNIGLVDVASIDVSPDFSFALGGDVAVLTLAAPTLGVPPTPINTTGTPAFGTSAIIAGFGITKGGADDSGIKRDGGVTTSSCSGLVPEPANVCWTFASPLGPPGEDSNTCSGDSGGPLFVDFGSGELLAGVTSGGSSGSCQPFDRSFDTNVFENSTFIQSVGGADLSNIACGSISQVGDGDTEEIRVESVLLSQLDGDVRACRKEVTKRYRQYTTKVLQARQACLDRINAGKAAGPCPDAATAATIAKAASKVDPVKMAKKCTTAVVPSIGATGSCAGASDATGLASCIIEAGDAVVDDLLDAEYVDTAPSSPLPEDEASCQAKIASTLLTYAKQRLTALTKCQARQDSGSTGSCPDLATQARIASSAGKVEPGIEKKCSDLLVSSLDQGDGFGGTCSGVSTTASLATCERSAHDASTDALVSILADNQTSAVTSFAVTPGTERFRVSLNGIEAGSNDLDLYVKRGAPPTTSDYDFRSNLAGMWDSVEATSPAAGTWYVLVDMFSGENVAYQLTVTQHQP